MWDAIAVTCSSTDLAAVIQEELNQLHKGGIVPTKTLLLAVEDPRPTIGSGGATINALFVICEHFSVREDLSVLTFDVLLNKRLLIIHAGREFVYESLAGIFVPLPCRYKSNTPYDFPVTNLHWTLQLLDQKIPESSPPGVWVYSGDLIIDTAQELDVSSCSNQDVIVFSVPVNKSTALQRGVFDTDEDGFLEEILFQTSPERIDEVRRCGDDSCYPMVIGFVYFPLGIAEQLLKLYSVPPLDACTYMGVDSGAPPINISLIFDVLASLGSKQRNLVNSKPSSAVILMQQVLHASRVRIVVLSDGRCRFMSKEVAETEAALNDICQESVLGFFEYAEIEPLGCAGLSAEEKKFASDLRKKKITAWRRQVPELPDDHMWYLHSEDNDNDKIGSETISDFCSRTGVTEDDLWNNKSPKNFRHARLFPVCSSKESIRILSCLFLSQSGADATIKEWRKRPRISIAEMRVDIRREYLSRRQRVLLTVEKRIAGVLTAAPDSMTASDHGKSLRPLMVWAVCVDCTNPLLTFMDSLACRMANSSGVVARILASIADFLATQSCKVGGLRSGPACNNRWMKAFAAFQDNQIETGVRLLAAERSQWLGTPTHLIRAARHYERAAQILICKAVQTAKTHMRAERRTENATCEAVTVECPARIDLSGAWSDTPPVCYESGGMIVNISVRVNGQLPIGARVQRIKKPVFRICIGGQQITIKNEEDLSDYNNPVSPGALVKAVLVFAEMTNPSNGGLRITTWSNLPCGSGLGTSSILAAALLTALWTLDGWKFTMHDIIHGVLIVEQLMTTGGGWQDQVGGLGLGFQVATSSGKLPLLVEYQKIPVDAKVLEEVESRLVLLYSGKTRLAKNLLHDTIRNWYARDQTVYQNVLSIVKNTQECHEAMMRGDLETVSRCVENMRLYKRVMAPGAETISVKQVYDGLDSILAGKCATGAGGGGFICGFLRPGVTREELEETVAFLKKDIPDMELYQSEVYQDGMKITKEPDASRSVQF